MNRTHRSVWNESLGAWVAASEIARVRGKRSSSALALVTTSLIMAACMPAWADYSVFDASFCARQSGGAANGTWTCQVPNGNGGFATISGVPDDGTGQPDNTALNNWVASKVGANAIALGNQATNAIGNSAIAIGSAAQATELRAIAIPMCRVFAYG